MDKRRPGVWRLRVYVGEDPITGRKRHVSKTFHGTQRQAETELAKFVTKTARGGHGAPSTMTVAGLLDAYCDHAENLGRSPTTIAEYRRQVENLRKGIGRTPLAKVRPHHVDELYAALGSRGVPGGNGPLSPASVRRYHALLGAAFRQAVKWAWVESSPVMRATPPSEPKARISAPSPAELRMLVDQASGVEGQEWRGLLIALAAMTGARRGELAALRWSDVDLEAGVVHFRRSVRQVRTQITEGPTKTRQERTVALPAQAVEMLRQFRAQLDDLAAETEIPLAADPYVFSPAVNRGRPYKPESLSQVFYRAAREAGLSYHLHQLRHFAATQLVGAGYDPVAVAARLGHSDPSVTLRVYSHALEDRDRAAADTLGEIVAPMQGPDAPK